jgi:ribose 5-phosphate isomerase B
MKIVLGCDHAGFEIKDAVIAHIKELGHEVVEVGTFSSASCHYPIFASAACEKVLSGECQLGILICGTGVGMSIAANKHKGIRAGLCGDPDSASLTRQHNNANVLCMGARILSFEKTIEITDAFLGAEFLGGRHQRRVDMLEN